MRHERDPEAIAHAREHAEWGEFEVVIVHEEHGELGTLDRTFNNDVDAGFAAHDAKISDVGIDTEVRPVTEHNPTP